MGFFFHIVFKVQHQLRITYQEIQLGENSWVMRRRHLKIMVFAKTVQGVPKLSDHILQSKLSLTYTDLRKMVNLLHIELPISACMCFYLHAVFVMLRVLKIFYVQLLKLISRLNNKLNASFKLYRKEYNYTFTGLIPDQFTIMNMQCLSQATISPSYVLLKLMLTY